MNIQIQIKGILSYLLLILVFISQGCVDPSNGFCNFEFCSVDLLLNFTVVHSIPLTLRREFQINSSKVNTCTQ